MRLTFSVINNELLPHRHPSPSVGLRYIEIILLGYAESKSGAREPCWPWKALEEKRCSFGLG